MADSRINQNTLNSYNTAYWQLRPKWQDLLNFYEPVPNVLSGYLQRSPVEDDDEYLSRQLRAAQVNTSKLILDFYRAMLFSTAVRIQAEKHEDRVREMEENATRQGDTLMDFMQDDVFLPSGLYGSVDVFGDLPATMSPPTSLAEQRDLKLDRPYFYSVHPLNRVRWQINENGNYNFYQSKDIEGSEIDPQFQIKHTEQYQLWTPNSFSIYRKDGSLVSEKVNPYGFIPAVTIIPLKSIRFYEDKIGISLVDEQLPLQKEMLNILSLSDDFFSAICFSQFVYKHDPQTAQGEPPEEGELKEMGNHRGLMLNGSGSDAKFISPDPSGVKSMLEFCDRLFDWQFQLALIPINSLDIKTHTSEKSIRNNLSQLYNKLTRMAKRMERATKQIIDMGLRIQGIDPKEANVSVQWDTNFSSESFINAVEQLAAFRSAIGTMSDTALREYAKKVCSSELYNTGKMDQIEKEIDRWSVNKASAVQPAADEAATLQKMNEGINQANKVVESR